MQEQALDQNILMEFLADRDEPCPCCNYNLRGLQGITCPECGEALRLRVGLERPHRGLYLAGLIGLAAGGGFSGLVFLYLVLDLVTSRYYPGGFGALVLVGEMIASALFMFGWVRFGKRFRRVSTRRQALLVAICWAWPIFAMILFRAVVF